MRLLALNILLATVPAAAEPPAFRSARPIWPAGIEREKNVMTGFRAVVEAPPDGRALLRVAASTVYRAWVNGGFLGYGPARGPHGYFRVDEWHLAPGLRPGPNLIAIEVAGYNANSYYHLDQPSFLQAEVVAGGDVLAATGDGRDTAFQALLLPERIRKVQRYSFQRPFSEAYRLAPGGDAWRRQIGAAFTPAACAAAAPPPLLPRRVPYPDFAVRPAAWHVASGTLKTGVEAKSLWKDRSLTQIGPKLGGFPEGELETIPSLDLQRTATASRAAVDRPLAWGARLTLKKNEWRLFDFGANLSGFIGLDLACRAPGRLVATFDEILLDGDVDFKRLGCVNAIALDLAPGTIPFESFEPYTLRYLKLILLDGECEIGTPTLREYANPAGAAAQFAASDPRLMRLFDAARETFRQNAVDAFMDCPSRERAGWLCDSFFTARTAFDLAGDTAVETTFLENFLKPDRFAHLPDGMLPMCYPADHNDGVFIPNWALWFVVQLEEYRARSGDRALVEALRPKVLKLFDYFKPFRNSDGLLEKLQGWVFVEWSGANQFVQDVNYPSNMLYAAALAAAARMYAVPELEAEAGRLRDVIRRQSFDGAFFRDHARRGPDGLQVRPDRSEVCQYFAFFFDVARPDTHADLWRTLRDEFGPGRDAAKVHPDVHKANAFIGNMLRLELLSRHGEGRRALATALDFLPMAERTGTLWEHMDPQASCNHGFASHIAHMLYRDALGIQHVDPVARTVDLRFVDLDLAWCEGRHPVPGGEVALRWWKDDAGVAYRASVPAGYAVRTENRTGRVLRRIP